MGAGGKLFWTGTGRLWGRATMGRGIDRVRGICGVALVVAGFCDRIGTGVGLVGLYTTETGRLDLGVLNVIEPGSCSSAEGDPAKGSRPRLGVICWVRSSGLVVCMRPLTGTVASGGTFALVPVGFPRVTSETIGFGKSCGVGFLSAFSAAGLPDTTDGACACRLGRQPVNAMSVRAIEPSARKC